MLIIYKIIRRLKSYAALWPFFLFAHFYTFSRRPKKAKQYQLWSDRELVSASVAIVIQGQLIRHGNFTLETIRIYKKIFPQALLIISTWDSESEFELAKFRNEGVEVVTSAVPAFRGNSNINLQIKSSSAGVEKARLLGAQYVLKTRSDQRIYAPNTLSYFINLLKVFPVRTGYDQQQRIISVSLDTYKYCLYSVSDMLVFGHIDDMANYWGCEPDLRKINPADCTNCREIYQMGFCGLYIVFSYLKRIGREMGGTLLDSWQCYADHYIIVDRSSIDLYWPKYHFLQEERMRDYSAIKNYRPLDFKEWFILYADLANKATVTDESLSLPFTATLVER